MLSFCICSLLLVCASLANKIELSLLVLFISINFEMLVRDSCLLLQNPDTRDNNKLADLFMSANSALIFLNEKYSFT